MSITPVTSAANGTLKRLRSLREKKYRRAEGLFLAEGLRITTEALEAGWVPEILVFAAGKQLWRKRLPAQSYTAPVVAGERVFVIQFVKNRSDDLVG